MKFRRISRGGASKLNKTLSSKMKPFLEEGFYNG